MSRATTRPDLEDLAAYIDGRLGDARRSEVEARLANDEGYYEVFLETLRFQRQESRQRTAGDDVVIPLQPKGRAPQRPRRRGRIGAAIAVAAALVLVVGVGLLDRPSALDQLDASSIVTNERWSEHGWLTTRGIVGEPPPPVAAFMLGANEIDLQVALDGGAAGKARAHASEVGKLAGLLGWRTAQRQAEELATLLDDESSADLPTAVEQAGQLAESIERGLEPSPHGVQYALGRWAELGRLAVLSENDEALGTVLDLPEDLAQHPELRPHGETLAVLAETLRRDPKRFSAEDRARAGEIFTAIQRDFTGSSG